MFFWPSDSCEVTIFKLDFYAIENYISVKKKDKKRIKREQSRRGGKRKSRTQIIYIMSSKVYGGIQIVIHFR